jgi:hypothetical protein
MAELGHHHQSLLYTSKRSVGQTRGADLNNGSGPRDVSSGCVFLSPTFTRILDVSILMEPET